MTKATQQVRPPLGGMRGRWNKAIREFENLTGHKRDELVKDGKLQLTEKDLRTAGMIVNKNFFNNSFPMHEVLLRLENEGEGYANVGSAYALGKHKIAINKDEFERGAVDKDRFLIGEGSLIRNDAQQLLQTLAHEMVHSANARWAPATDLKYDYHGPDFQRHNRLFNGLDTTHDYFGHVIEKNKIPSFDETGDFLEVKLPPRGASTDKSRYYNSTLPYTRAELEQGNREGDRIGLEEMRNRRPKQAARIESGRKKRKSSYYLPLFDPEDEDTREKRLYAMAEVLGHTEHPVQDPISKIQRKRARSSKSLK
eukprot:jgi/Mesvir1/10255/Mv08575-RA.1